MLGHFDRHWTASIAETVSKSALDFGVALGLDGVTDSNGSYNKGETSLYVPDEWVFECVKTEKNLLPGPSIHPNRPDAISRLSSCIDRGSVLIHWIPAVQKIDPADTRLRKFYQILKDASIPLLIQCGDRSFLPTNDIKLSRLDALMAPLEAGVTVICGRSGTNSMTSLQRNQLGTLKKLLLRYDHLFLDNSGLCSSARFFHTQGLAQDPLFADRTLYGSGLPVAANPFYFVRQIGLRKTIEIKRHSNAIDRDLAIKKHLGYPLKTEESASSVLANVNLHSNSQITGLNV